jgi:hypothetical protein
MNAMPVPRPLIAAALVAAVAGAACTSSDSDGSATSTPASNLAAEAATADLYVGAPQRVQVGIFSSDSEGVRLVSFGTARFRFSFLGDGSSPPEPGPEATASFVPAPGVGETGPTPTITDPADARGVYEADGVTFDAPGIWQVIVSIDIEGMGPQDLRATFPVRSEPRLPAPGDRAPRTDTLTMRSDVEPQAIDSRALDGAPVPDPELHRWTIARAIAEHRPVLAIFATPVYCLSRFCGPVTDAVQALEREYGDRAAFVHVEIWHDYDKSEVNKGAADWLLRSGDIVEPWLYLIGDDGVIADRWGPLFDVDEVAAALEALPRSKS